MGPYRWSDNCCCRGSRTGVVCSPELVAIDGPIGCFWAHWFRECRILWYVVMVFYYDYSSYPLLQASRLIPGLHVCAPSEPCFDDTAYSWTYNASFFFKVPTASDTDLVATIALQTSSGSVLAASNVTIPGNQTSWTQAFTTLTPSSSASDASNNFTVTMDGATAAGATINFAMFSLMPPTFKGRENGMRMDIAEVQIPTSVYISVDISFRLSPRWAQLSSVYPVVTILWVFHPD
jgi:hypothetical protein